MKKIVIIGAGLGGLTAGNLLAKKGYQIKIFESHNAPGGYTAGFRCKGFYFESGTLSFESSNTIFKAMQEIGILDKIEFVRQKSRWLSAYYDGTSETYHEFKNLFYTAFPDEKLKLKRYFTETDKMVQAMQPFVLGKKKFFNTLFSGYKLFRLFRRYNNVPISEFTNRFFDKNTILNQFFKYWLPGYGCLADGGSNCHNF